MEKDAGTRQQNSHCILDVMQIQSNLRTICFSETFLGIYFYLQNNPKFQRLDSHHEMNSNLPNTPSNTVISIENMQATPKI